MRPRYPIALLALLALSAPARNARAEVVLRSAELTRHSEVVPRGGPAEVSDTTEPFPNDAAKFAGVEPEGLRVSVDELSGSYSSILGNLIISISDDNGFRVVFDVDEPSPFAFHRGYDPVFPDFAAVTLRAEGAATPVVPSFHRGDLAGMLAPGSYTFSAYTATPAIPGGQRGTATSTIRDVRLTVAPEPAALALLAPALLLCLARRRS